MHVSGFCIQNSHKTEVFDRFQLYEQNVQRWMYAES